jgi:choline dehydrogenase-like flavoprotein
MKRHFDADAIVIGLGAGGAVAAHTLVEAGLSVIGLDAGGPPSPDLPDEITSYGPMKYSMNSTEYFSGVDSVDLNDSPHVYRNDAGKLTLTSEGWTSIGLGGGSNRYGAVSIRFHPRDFALREYIVRSKLKGSRSVTAELLRDVRDWPINAHAMEEPYADIENFLGISGELPKTSESPPSAQNHYQKPLPPSAEGETPWLGMKLHNMHEYRTPQAFITANHIPSQRTIDNTVTASMQGLLTGYPDPSGRKSSTFVTHIKPLLTNNRFDLRCYSTAFDFKLERGRVTEVLYRNAFGELRTASARIVVLALGAVETIRLCLLAASNSRDLKRRIARNGLLGRHFMSHVFSGAEVIDPGLTSNGSDFGLESDWATNHCQTDEYLTQHGLWAGGVVYNVRNRLLPIGFARNFHDQGIDRPWASFLSTRQLIGQNVLEWMTFGYGRVRTVVAIGNQVPRSTNCIKLASTIKDRWGLPVAQIKMKWHQQDLLLAKRLAETCRDILESGTGLKVQSFGSVCDSDNSQCRLNHHLLGGLRFGNCEEDSVLNADCRFWGLTNLYATDGSFMPTGGGANPTLTIQANALRVSRLIKQRV